LAGGGAGLAGAPGTTGSGGPRRRCAAPRRTPVDRRGASIPRASRTQVSQGQRALAPAGGWQRIRDVIEKVAFIGLGVMGFPMAGHLSRAGLEVAVYNRTPARAEAWRRQFAGRVAATPAAAAAGAELVLACVGRD